MTITKGEIIRRLESLEDHSFSMEEKMHCDGVFEIVIKIAPIIPTEAIEIGFPNLTKNSRKEKL